MFTPALQRLHSPSKSTMGRASSAVKIAGAGACAGAAPQAAGSWTLAWLDTLPRKPQTPASESSEEESSDESGSEYSEDGPDWIEGWDPNHKHVYYFNHVTEVTTWARPNNEDVRPMSAKDAARRREDLLNK